MSEGEALGSDLEDEVTAYVPPIKDPDEVDLTAIPDFGPPFGISTEKWKELNEWMAIFMDPMQGARATRARYLLLKEGVLAFPVIVNTMKTLDLATEEGNASGDLCQRALMDLCHGINFDWRYPDQDPGIYHWYNKKVIVAWANQWTKVEESGIEYFIAMAKLDTKDPAEAERLRTAYGED